MGDNVAYGQTAAQVSIETNVAYGYTNPQTPVQGTVAYTATTNSGDITKSENLYDYIHDGDAQQWIITNTSYTHSCTFTKPVSVDSYINKKKY